MKRMMAILLLMCLMLSDVPAHAAGAELTWQRAVDMALYMREVAMGDFLAINGVPADLQATARSWVEGMDDSPCVVVRLMLEKDTSIQAAMALMRNEPEIVQYEMASTLLSSQISSLILGAYYHEAYNSADDSGITTDTPHEYYETILEINSLFQFERIYADAAAQGLDDAAVYLVVYDDAAAALILVAAENGAVALSGMLLPFETLRRVTNYGQVSLWMMMINHPVTCEEVRPE